MRASVLGNDLGAPPPSTDRPIDRRDHKTSTAPKGLMDLDLLNHGPVAPSPSRSAGLGELAAGADGLEQSVLRRRLAPPPRSAPLEIPSPPATTPCPPLTNRHKPGEHRPIASGPIIQLAQHYKRFRGGSRFVRDLLFPMAPVQSLIREPLTSVIPKSSQSAETHLRPHHLKKFIGHTVFGAALLMTCLQAGAASALSFNFSFSGFGFPNTSTTVTGIVAGLVDNQADQTTGLTFTITSATNTPTLGWSTFSSYSCGQGIDVFGGQVTGADVVYINSFDGQQFLYLGNQGSIYPALGDNISSNDGIQYLNVDSNPTSANTLVFVPAPVPGPLSLFGAGAAFGWSRRLRRRIKSPA